MKCFVVLRQRVLPVAKLGAGKSKTSPQDDATDFPLHSSSTLEQLEKAMDAYLEATKHRIAARSWSDLVVSLGAWKPPAARTGDGKQKTSPDSGAYGLPLVVRDVKRNLATVGRLTLPPALPLPARQLLAAVGSPADSVPMHDVINMIKGSALSGGSGFVVGGGNTVFVGVVRTDRSYDLALQLDATVDPLTGSVQFSNDAMTKITNVIAEDALMATCSVVWTRFSAEVGAALNLHSPCVSDAVLEEVRSRTLPLPRESVFNSNALERIETLVRDMQHGRLKLWIPRHV